MSIINIAPRIESSLRRPWPFKVWNCITEIEQASMASLDGAHACFSQAISASRIEFRSAARSWLRSALQQPLCCASCCGKRPLLWSVHSDE